MRFIPIIFNILLFFSFATAYAQTDQNFPITGTSSDPAMEEFDKKLVALMKKWNMPGASVAVIQNGKFIAGKGYGWSNKERNQVMQPNNLFRIASVSKTFTAVAVLKLVEQGKLRLDDKVFDILNDLTPLPNSQINPKIKQITVKNLLQMSSGWFTRGSHSDPLFGPWSGNIKKMLSPELPASCATIARYMMSAPLKHKPGTQYAYSNVDYCVLGLVVNKVAGTRYGYEGYQQYVNQHVLYPLNIRNMAIGSTQLKYKIPGEVTYYQDTKYASPEELANSSYLPYSDTELLKKNFANGGWISTAENLAWFAQGLRNHRILRPDVLQLMYEKPPFREKEAKNYYTVGAQMHHDAAGNAYWLMTGSFTGTNAYVITKPNGTTIALVFNSRPSIYNFLSKFRPELKSLLVNSKV